MFYFFIPFLIKRHHFISNLGEDGHFTGNFGEEDSVYWLFERGCTCTILLGKFERRFSGIFFIYAQNCAGGWKEFPFMTHTFPGGLDI